MKFSAFFTALALLLMAPMGSGLYQATDTPTPLPTPTGTQTIDGVFPIFYEFVPDVEELTIVCDPPETVTIEYVFDLPEEYRDYGQFVGLYVDVTGTGVFPNIGMPANSGNDITRNASPVGVGSGLRYEYIPAPNSAGMPYQRDNMMNRYVTGNSSMVGDDTFQFIAPDYDADVETNFEDGEDVRVRFIASGNCATVEVSAPVLVYYGFDWTFFAGSNLGACSLPQDGVCAGAYTSTFAVQGVVVRVLGDSGEEIGLVDNNYGSSAGYLDFWDWFVGATDFALSGGDDWICVGLPGNGWTTQQICDRVQEHSVYLGSVSFDYLVNGKSISVAPGTVIGHTFYGSTVSGDDIQVLEIWPIYYKISPLNEGYSTPQPSATATVTSTVTLTATATSTATVTLTPTPQFGGLTSTPSPVPAATSTAVPSPTLVGTATEFAPPTVPADWTPEAGFPDWSEASGTFSDDCIVIDLPGMVFSNAALDSDWSWTVGLPDYGWYPIHWQICFERVELNFGYGDLDLSGYFALLMGMLLVGTIAAIRNR